MTKAEQKYYDEIAAFMKTIIRDVVTETVAKTLKAVELTKGDSISQRQAEREFGKSWLHQHIKAGLVNYTQAVCDDYDHNNTKRTFSRAELAELRRAESTDITAYQRFVIAFRQVHEGYVTFDMMPDGVQEMFLRQRLEETQRRLDVVNARLHPKKKGAEQ